MLSVFLVIYHFHAIYNDVMFMQLSNRQSVRIQYVYNIPDAFYADTLSNFLSGPI